MNYLSLLTPERSFRLFVAALALSAALIWSGLGPAWLSVIPVFAYGAALLRAQRAHLVALSGTVKDSPYFLGFILTMFALAKIFSDVAAAPPGKASVSTIVGDAGAAILATVAGLFCRQVLMSLDPGEDARDAVFQSIARELRERTVEFHETQARFVGLVREFVAARETMFSREETAFARYVERLEAGAAHLTRLQQHYPSSIEALVGGVDDAVTRLRSTADESERRIAALPARLAADVEKESVALAHSLAESGRVVAAARIAAEAEARAAETAFGTTLDALRTRAAEMDRASAAYPDAITRLVDALSAVVVTSATVRQELATLADQARTSSDALSGAVGEVRSDAEALRGIVEERATAMRAELAAVDGVVEELIQVLRDRLEVVAGRV